ncbi:MAG: hypothetical protein FJ398_18430 [Verrucomicrobia bacterium]|nr:hypothetical protein [Verrucomicrobiota bacterium]
MNPHPPVPGSAGRWSLNWLLGLSLLLTLAKPVLAASKGEMLFVTSNADSPINADPAFIEFFTANGYVVTLFGAGGSTPEDLRAAAAGKKVVVFSETIGSTSVLDPAGDATGVFSLKNTDVPIISFEAYMFDNADWVKRTADGSNDFTQWGNTSRTEVADTPINDGRDSLYIRKADHPIAKGFTGKVKVYNELYSLSYGLPSPDADVVASVQENGTFPTIFVYEKGDKLVDGSVAPNKRIGLFLGQNAAPDFNTALDFANLTAAGKQLVLQTVDYAAGVTSGTTTPPPVTPPPAASNIIYVEDFNTEGEGTRYTVEGRGFVPKNGQAVPVPAGTSYWTRNVDVVAKGEVVGVPFPAPARRATMLFNHGLDPASLTADGKKLLDATIKWLTEGKQKMVVMFSAPAGADSLGDQYLISTLTAQGHTVIDDDTSVTLPAKITADKVDFIINSSTGGDPIRLANATVPLLCFASDLAGDMLLATRGLNDTTFDPGDVKIAATTHPIAAGLPATIKFVNAAQPFDTVGLGLPAGSVTVATYQFTDDAGVVSTRPFLVATEKGVQLLGGLISGMEGTGYWAGADLNEPNISNSTFGTINEPRSLTLKPVNVTGKTNLKLTLALAGTEVDFDLGADDFFSIKVDLKNTGEFIELARYGAPTANEKFLVERIKGGDGMGGPTDLVKPDYTKRVGIVAKEFTYDIPDGATQLVVRFESNSTFWNEIVAFDNIRIHTGALAAPKPLISIKRDADKVVVEFGGVLQSANSVTGPWTDVAGNPKSPYTIERGSQATARFLRARAP